MNLSIAFFVCVAVIVMTTLFLGIFDVSLVQLVCHPRASYGAFQDRRRQAYQEKLGAARRQLRLEAEEAQRVYYGDRHIQRLQDTSDWLRKFNALSGGNRTIRTVDSAYKTRLYVDQQVYSDQLVWGMKPSYKNNIFWNPNA